MQILFLNRFGVYHWKEYILEDKTTKDKYWLSLNCMIDQEEYHAVLQTSKVEKYKFNTIDTFIITANSSSHFKVDTLLDFKKLKINTKSEIQKAFENNKFEYLGLLEKEIQKQVEDTILNSETLSELLVNTLLCRENKV